MIDGVPYAFIGLERVGGILVYDVSTPTAPEFKSYINTRDFTGDPEKGTAGDRAPEGIAFIPAETSPNGKPIEVSGTTVLFDVVVK